MNNFVLIKTAITNKMQVVAKYNGHVREMCPHLIGVKKDKIHALFYQFGGTSASGRIVPGSEDNWRCIEVMKLEEVKLRRGRWYTAEVDLNQTCIDQVDTAVDWQ